MLCRRQGIECVAEQLVASEEGLFCMMLIVFRCNDFDSYIGENIQSVPLLSGLMKVPFLVMTEFILMLCYVLQSSSYSLHILPSSSGDACVASSDCVCHIGNINVEEDLDMEGEKGEVTVKTEKGVASEEEECIDIKDEEGIYSEEEEEEDIGIKEKVSLQSTV